MAFRQRVTGWLRISYRLFHVYWQSLRGAWKVSKLKPPVVSIFGGALARQNDFYARKAFELARMLSDAGISVLTGGGPGIMQAASCGIMPGYSKGKGRTIGIGVTDLDEKPNHCVHEYIVLDYFFARKWLLTRYASAVVFFPGGFGTCDELFEILTLVQTKKTRPMPVILFGVEYWKPLYEWLLHEPLQHQFLRSEHLTLFTITDDLSMVFCLVRDQCRSVRSHNIGNP